MKSKITIIEFNNFDKILSVVFRRYTYKVHRNGVSIGYNWAKNNMKFKN